MPDFKTHLIYGFGLGLLLYILFRNPFIIIITALYSIMPDLDINTSTPFRFYAIAASIYAIYMLVIPQEFYSTLFGYDFPQRYFAIPPLLGLIILQFIPHREWLHSLSAGLVFAIPIWFFVNFGGFIAALLGYYLHLLLDKELFDGLFT